MIKSNVRLVISIAKNYQGAGMNLQDLVQVSSQKPFVMTRFKVFLQQEVFETHLIFLLKAQLLPLGADFFHFILRKGAEAFYEVRRSLMLKKVSSFPPMLIGG